MKTIEEKNWQKIDRKMAKCGQKLWKNGQIIAKNRGKDTYKKQDKWPKIEKNVPLIGEKRAMGVALRFSGKAIVGMQLIFKNLLYLTKY